MTDPTPFNRLLGERARRLVEKDGRSMEAISRAAGLGLNALSRIVRGCPVKVETLMAALYELDAGPREMDAIYADFSENKRERVDG